MPKIRHPDEPATPPTPAPRASTPAHAAATRPAGLRKGRPPISPPEATLIRVSAAVAVWLGY